MKTCCIPLIILSAILLFSIFTNLYVQNSCSYWIDELEAVSELVDIAQWETAQKRTQDILQDWHRHGKIYHMLIEHQDLDEAEDLFYASMAAFHTKNTVESQINLYLLISQLRYIAATQDAALENFL